MCWKVLRPCWNSGIYICDKNTLASLDELKPFHKQTANRTVTYLREEGVEDDVNVVLC